MKRWRVTFPPPGHRVDGPDSLSALLGKFIEAATSDEVAQAFLEAQTARYVVQDWNHGAEHRQIIWQGCHQQKPPACRRAEEGCKEAGTVRRELDEVTHPDGTVTSHLYWFCKRHDPTPGKADFIDIVFAIGKPLTTDPEGRLLYNVDKVRTRGKSMKYLVGIDLGHGGGSLRPPLSVTTLVHPDGRRALICHVEKGSHEYQTLPVKSKFEAHFIYTKNTGDPKHYRLLKSKCSMSGALVVDPIEHLKIIAPGEWKEATS